MSSELATIKMYRPDSSVEMDVYEAMDFLKKRGFFDVFLSFIDPRTDVLVQSNFKFYPKPQRHSRDGRLCFIAEYKGLPLRIPSDLKVYAQHQYTGMFEVHQEASALVEGEYKNFSFELGISPNIRLL